MGVALLQELCQLGQDELVRMDYLKAEKWLAEAGRLARQQGDLDTLSRLYMPLQETRRQRRIRCGEGVLHLGLIAEQEDDQIDGRRVVENFPHGQLLVAGWGTVGPALKVRELAVQYELYVETFLAAVFPTDHGRAVVIVPSVRTPLPPIEMRSLEELEQLMPAPCIVLPAADLPTLPRKSDAQSFARTSALWTQLHLPLLQAADAMEDSHQKIDAYTAAIDADYACELAHQNLSKCAHRLARRKPAAT